MKSPTDYLYLSKLIGLHISKIFFPPFSAMSQFPIMFFEFEEEYFSFAFIYHR